MVLEACPAVMMTCPGSKAVMIGGSSVDRLTMVESLAVQLRPCCTFPFASKACKVRVPPTTMLTIAGCNDGRVFRKS